jgi:hypothetical protein
MSKDKALGNHGGKEVRPWGAIPGCAVIGLYTSLTLIAIARFPGTVSPADTYLSMLGNADLSPGGAGFYNLAVILTGLAELAFFVALYSTYSHYGPAWLLAIGLLAGLINGLAVSMSGIYAQHVNMGAHITWSYVIFFSLIPLLLAFNLFFWTLHGTTRRISSFGFIVCAIGIFFLAILLSGHPGPIMEWVSVFSLMVWFGFVSLDVLIMSRAKRQS